MRRSAVRTLERAGVPRSVAMSIVGHTESIYRRYAIVDEAMQREAAARLDAWMPAPSPAPSTGTVTAFRTGTGSERDQLGITGVRRRRRDWPPPIQPAASLPRLRAFQTVCLVILLKIPGLDRAARK